MALGHHHLTIPGETSASEAGQRPPSDAEELSLDVSPSDIRSLMYKPSELIIPIRSMVLVYLPTKLGDVVRVNVGKYSSTMERMGIVKIGM